MRETLFFRKRKGFLALFPKETCLGFGGSGERICGSKGQPALPVFGKIAANAAKMKPDQGKILWKGTLQADAAKRSLLFSLGWGLQEKAFSEVLFVLSNACYNAMVEGGGADEK